MNSALERGAKIYAEIVGYGVSSDAYHLSTPDPEAKGAYYSMKNAIEDGGINPADLDYVNAHGTSTYYNDLNETKAIKQLFGDKAYKLKISSIKSMIGHSLGAAGGIEAVATVLTVKTGIIPPTINLKKETKNAISIMFLIRLKKGT
jgi:3-oxoacyl-[acyl-carrier-protein] synthase II (EC 2.3.1.41)